MGTPRCCCALLLATALVLPPSTAFVLTGVTGGTSLIERRHRAAPPVVHEDRYACALTIRGLSVGTTPNDAAAAAAPAGGFTRDPSDNLSSDVNIEAVRALIKERKKARKSQHFSKADAILNQLREEHCVLVDDKTKTWKTTSNTGKVTNSLRRGDDKEDVSAGGSHEHNHGFVLSPDAGPISSDLSEREIHAKIGERMRARRGRKFKDADRIRNQLKDSGVYLDDNKREWRADGKSFVGHTKGGDSGGILSQSSFSSSVSRDDEDHILNLIAQRERYRRDQEYKNADAIRDDLQRRYDVHVNDRLGEWSAGGNFGEKNHDANSSCSEFKKSSNSVDLAPSDEEYVQGKVEERLRAKKKRNYALADSIRAEILHRYSVTVQDEINQWSAGGDFGDDAPRNRGEYTRRGGMGEFNSKQCAAISVMVHKRHEAKRAHQFDRADEIRDSLFDKYGIRIDDKRFLWYVDGDASEPSDDNGSEPRFAYNNACDSGEIQGKDLPMAMKGDAVAPLREEFMTLTVVQLKEKLRACGKKVGGKKEKLIDRLLQ